MSSLSTASELAAVRAAAPPAIDYTDKDFASFRRALFELATLRLPEWTDRSPADIGVLLVDLFAYLGDVISYHQDRLASEQFLATAVERATVQDLLRLIGYELRPPVAATAELSLWLDEPTTEPMLTIPAGTTFETKPDAATGAPALPFTYTGPDLAIDRSTLPVDDGKRRFDGLPVTQCRVIPAEVLGATTGEPSQSFALAFAPVIASSVEVRLGSGADAEGWNRRDNLLYHVGDDLEAVSSGLDDHDFMLRFDAKDPPGAVVVFGDGVYGAVPRRGSRVTATYQAGGGGAGNVAPWAIAEMKPKLAGVARAANPRPATGGADAESVEHARRFGPLAFRSGDRAVTLSDFVTLARQAGGVAKVRARSSGWNRIDLYVGAEGDVFSPASPQTRQRLVAFFENRRMVGTSVRIQDPTAVAIDITVQVWIEHHRDPVAVLAATRDAVRQLVAYRNVDFGRPLYLSKVYEAVEALAGVAAATVTEFRRADQRPAPLLVRRHLDRAGLGNFTRTVDEVVAGAVPTYGRIEIGEYEIPVEGEVVVVEAGEAKGER